MNLASLHQLSVNECYYPEVVLQGCWTKSKQNPRLSDSAVPADPSVESVCTTILKGVLKPEK